MTQRTLLEDRDDILIRLRIPGSYTKVDYLPVALFSEGKIGMSTKT